MALKDWKTERFGSGKGMTFNNKKREDYFIQVYYDASHSPPWRTVVHADGKVIKEDQSSSRQQGIIKAKSYMRSH